MKLNPILANLTLKSFKSNHSYKNGFAITQILILGIGIAVSVSGILATSILRFKSTKISRQELLAKTASDSGITNLRSLLNDNRDNYFYYYWLTKSCSSSAQNCPSNLSKGYIPIPPKEFWKDDEWCKGSNNCLGRQKAPICSYDQPIDWKRTKKYFSLLLDGKPDYIGINSTDKRLSYKQTFDIKSTEFVGSEDYGINSILIEGQTSSVRNNKITGSNKLRVNIQVIKEIPDKGLGYLSVGENEGDGKDSLYLGNLQVKRDNNSSTGTIIWRRNLYNQNECENIKQSARSFNSISPKTGDGGIWVQPIKLPKYPSRGGYEDLGILICTPNNKRSKCSINENPTKNKNYRLNSLFVRGVGSEFSIYTRNKSKVVLEVSGDIDVSNGGKFCHRDGVNGKCGSGKPENLTILFKPQEKEHNGTNKLVCNRDLNSNGGVKLINRRELTKVDQNSLPLHSFLIDNTSNNGFNAYIYGPKLTLISVLPEQSWKQLPARVNKSNLPNPIVVTTRGVYGWIHNTGGSRWKDKMPRVFLSPNRKLIPYNNGGILNEDISFRGINIIGVGYKRYLPNYKLVAPKNMVLIYDNKQNSKGYYLRSFTIKDINSAAPNNSRVSLPISVGLIKAESNATQIYLGQNLESQSAKKWLNIYGLNITKNKSILKREFKGAAWVKNLCLDNKGEITWNFPTNLFEDHYVAPKWGVGYYRGRSIMLWDTLRDFN